jgi:2-polyprenyl-3-methyl-5-hydroxy-6-metoxy-1,4-benzoquinol methylase
MTPGLFERGCPVCEKSESVEFLRKEELRLVQCSACGMVYANPVPEELATGHFYDQLATPFYLSPDKLQSDYAPVRFQRELKLFRKFCAGGKVLDVGCSTGAFLFQLRQRHGAEYEILGIDVAGPALDYAEKQGVPVLRESFLTTPLQEGSFSAITFWAVLEHLLKPREFLARAASLLKPEGYCFVLVPNFRSLAVRLLGAKYRYILPQHVNYFDLSSLVKIASADSRFTVAYKGATHFNPFVIAQDWRRGATQVPDAERARLLKQTTGLKQNPLLKPAKWALAGCEFILGQFYLADNLAVVLRKTSQ